MRVAGPDGEAMTRRSEDSDDGCELSRRETLKSAVLGVIGTTGGTAYGLGTSGYVSTVSAASARTTSYSDEFGGGANNPVYSRWSYRYQAGATPDARDGDYEPLPHYNPTVGEWRSPDNDYDIPLATSKGVHPGPNGELVAISWLAPESVTIDIDYGFENTDASGGNGIDWWVEHRDGDGGLVSTLDSGSVGNGGADTGRSTTGVSVAAGERINFVVGADGDSGNDFTAVDAAITYTTGDTTAPSVPSNLTVEGRTDSRVDLSWDGSTDDGRGVSHYNIYVDGSLWRHTERPADTVYRLSAGSSYDIAVSAVDAVGNESATSDTLTVTTDGSGSGTTYYVDADTGSDANSGTAEASAWGTLSNVQTTTFSDGDEILLRSGTEYSVENLELSGSGSAGATIRLDKYDTGAKPRIDGTGTKGTVYLENGEYWEIAHIDATNYADGQDFNCAVRAKLDGFGEATHLVVRDCYLHDCYHSGSDHDWQWTADGIRIECDDAGNGASHWDDVRVVGNTIRRPKNEGIWVTSDFDLDPASTNVVIRENLIEDAGGGGIHVGGTDGALIEHNRVDVHSKRGGCTVGIWCAGGNGNGSKATTAQFNAVLRGMNAACDGKAYDVDLNSTGATFQYNYSKHNAGGAFLFIATDGETVDGATVRYNISERDGIDPAPDVDGSGAGQVLDFYGSDGITDLEIYNNVYYADDTVQMVKDDASNVSGTVTNNIFYVANGDANLSNPGSLDFENNCYYGSTVDTLNDSSPITSDPQFQDPGSGGRVRDDVAGYKLQAGSPCVGSGVSVSDNGGRDYWGNSVASDGPDDVGAHSRSGSGDATAPTAPSNLTSPGHDSSSVDLSWDASSDTGGSGVDHYDVYVDGSPDTEVAAGTTNATVTGLSPDVGYDFHVTATDGAGNESDASNTVTVTTDASSGSPSPSHRYAFDGSSATDSAGSADGTINGSPTTGVGGKDGSAWSFDGSDDYVTVADGDITVAPQFTVAVWINTSAFDSTAQTYVLSKFDWDNKTGTQLIDDGQHDSEMVFRVLGDGGYTDARFPRSDVNDDTWHHVVGTFDGDTVRIYLDGTEQAATSGASKDQSSATMGIAGSGGGSYLLAGSLDDVRVYDQALTSTEVQNLYDSYTG